MSILRWLRVRPLIVYVLIAPEEFAFSAENETLRMAAAGSREQGGKTGWVARSVIALPGNPVALFSESRDAESPAVTSLRYAVLVMVLRRGFTELLESRFLKLRPHVTFGGASSLEPMLHGFQYGLLRQAAFDAGAATVAFAEEKHPLPNEVTRRRPDPRTRTRDV